MGTTLIFVGLVVVTDFLCCTSLSDWTCFDEVPGNSSTV